MHVLTESFSHAYSAVPESARFGPLFVDDEGTLGPRTPVSATDLDQDPVDAAESPENAPAVHLCRQIVFDALRTHATDIQIEPGQRDCRVRLRVDGVLHDHLQLPGWMHSSFVSGIKALAKLDIEQHRLPQNGRIRIMRRNRSIDLRVSTRPGEFGEKVNLHLLDSSEPPSLAELGLSANERTLIEKALIQPQGLILVVGPEGAGKTTTLYSMLSRRQSPETKIATIEDAIDQELPGVHQVQVDSTAGLTFAKALRTILRQQDPDVILVGDLCDRETAEIAFEAAQTGHLVLGTLHASSSIEAIDRLLDLGIPAGTVSSATNLIIAQRLARRICTICREPYEPSPDVLRWLRIGPHRQFERGRGCVRCGHTGYAGRFGLFEVLNFTRRFREWLTRGASPTERKRAAACAGVRFLLDDALSKVHHGLTTVEEVLRVIRLDPVDQKFSNRAAACDSNATRRARLRGLGA